MKDKLSILLVDDHDAILEGISVAINKTFLGVILHKATTPEKAEAILNKEQIDIAIVDISFREISDISGVALCEKIIKIGGTKTISYTGFYQTANLQRLIQIGVDGIVSKNDGNKALIEAIKKVMNNETEYSQEILKEFPHIINERKNIEKNKALLTSRQKQIVDLIALSKSNKEIADKLSLTVKTIEGHIANIASCLGLKKTDRIQILRKMGRILD